MGVKREPGRADSPFEDFGSFEAIRVGIGNRTGNIIKGNQVVTGGACAIELHEGGDDEPSVVIHRDHNKISRIEFICSCGRGTSLTMEYKDE
jgi:hypothetical protein